MQERLGHANIGITLDTYSHVLPSIKTGARGEVGCLIKSAMAENEIGCQWLSKRADPDAGKPCFFPQIRRVSEWLAATLEMSCRETGCGFESRALRSDEAKCPATPCGAFLLRSG